MRLQSRLLSDAAPELAIACREVMAVYARRFAPWHLIVTSVWRSPLVQEALYAQGRVQSKTELNAIRDRAGLPPIYDEDEAHRVVTWTRASNHTRTPARAVDFAVAIDPDGPAGPLKPRIDWDDERRYRQMGEIAESLGLVWGGRWKRPDLCHVELPKVDAAGYKATGI